ncbi:ATP-binding protein [Streptomyces pseudogriseolus]|uniref:ATP-binding protein n=1 Tax=Streptomyces pseudogriseolus TaxID=36817 RepID=UPI003FA2A97A
MSLWPTVAPSLSRSRWKGPSSPPLSSESSGSTWISTLRICPTASLLVAELAANAVRHGRARGRDFVLRLTLYAEDATLRIEVTDARPDRSVPLPCTLTPADADTESGRGLLLVESLSTHWGATAGDPYTKTVWCEVPLTGRPG